MVNWLNIFNPEWFQKVTALQKQWYDFFNNSNSFQRLFNLSDNLSGPSLKESAAPNNFNHPAFEDMANWLNILSIPFLQSGAPKINKSLPKSLSPPVNLLFGILPGLILGFSRFFL